MGAARIKPESSTNATAFAILVSMSEPAQPIPDLDDDAAETATLAAAVAAARADRRAVPHEDMRAWLLEVVAGDLDAPPPEPRVL